MRNQTVNIWMLWCKSLLKMNEIGFVMGYKNVQYWLLWYSICSWHNYYYTFYPWMNLKTSTFFDWRLCSPEVIELAIKRYSTIYYFWIVIRFVSDEFLFRLSELKYLAQKSILTLKLNHSILINKEKYFFTLVCYLIKTKLALNK